MNIECYNEILGLQQASFSKIEHENAIVALVYKITLDNVGNEYILKICDRPNDYLREVKFLNLFADQILVPKIIKTVAPTEDVHGAILMECLPGALLCSTEYSKSVAFDLGKTLAIIHSHRMSGYGDPLFELNQDPEHYFSFKFDEGLEECKNNLPTPLIETCRNYYDSYREYLQKVDGPCVVHRDFRPGNIIVHEGKLQGVIDWAGARASFAEEDFATIDQGDWVHNQESFLEGYASVRQVPNYSIMNNFLKMNKAIATLGFLVKRGTWDGEHAAIYTRNRRFLETL